MKKHVYKIISIIIVCAFLVVGLLVSASLLNSKRVMISQAEKSISYMSETYAKEFDKVFSDAELVVNSVAETIEREYQVKEYINDRGVFEDKMNTTGEIIESVINEFDYPIGLYITFAPETSKGKDEIWYIKDRDGNVDYINSLDMSDSWLDENNPTTAYYFETIREGSLWLDSNYDPGMDGETVTYAKAMYDSDNDLIGVIGTDILVEDIFKSLEDINEETDGYSAFIENGNRIIAGTDVAKYRNSSEYIYAEADIGEKWEIALAQPVEVAVDPIIKTEAAVILLGILIILTVIVFIFYYSKKHVSPMIQEVELKDAMLINRARQAKMGEMVGNIAHQWKQPLNGMRMALSNIQDDYNNDMIDKESFENYIYRMKLMVDNLSETADDFTAFLRPGKKTEIFSANREIERVINLTDERIRLYGIDVAVDGAEIFLEGYRNEFTQCLFNLLDNAFDALKEKRSGDRKVRITTGLKVVSSEEEYSLIKIFNNGEPIEEENRDKIFDIYFTTKNCDEGTGIGLYLVKQILRKHFNGDIFCENVEDGVCFIIRILNKGKE